MQYNRDPNASGRQSMMRRRRTTIVKGDAKIDDLDLNEDGNEGQAQEDESPQGLILGQQIQIEEMKEDHFGGSGSGSRVDTSGMRLSMIQPQSKPLIMKGGKIFL